MLDGAPKGMVLKHWKPYRLDSSTSRRIAGEMTDMIERIEEED